VEAINEYAFVASDYPVILSIENHCNRYPKLIDRMDEIFRDVFGDKLLAVPLGDYPLEPGVPLPSPELLKRKIVIKDKVSAPKGGSSNANTGTLQRTGTIPEVVEEIEPPKEENQTQTKEEADNIAPLPSANKNNQSSLRPMVKRPSLFKGMTILEDTDDGIQSDSPSMRKTPSLEKGNSDDKPSSEEKQPVEEKSNPPVQKKISMEKKESVDESSAPVVCLLYVASKSSQLLYYFLTVNYLIQ
jgi:phosphatidylinositol phospholipase C beta